MDFMYTKHQTARGARADAEVGGKIFLIKKVSMLRLTYQIKMLAYMASVRGKMLVIRLPKTAKVHADLNEYVKSNSGLVKVERE